MIWVTAMCDCTCEATTLEQWRDDAILIPAALNRIVKIITTACDFDHRFRSKYDVRKNIAYFPADCSRDQTT